MAKDWTGNKKSTWATLGASNHTDKEREEWDYYATDPKALDLLSPVFPIHHKVYEPSCGEGHLSKWLINHGHDVLSTDLVDRGFGIGGIDFLKVGTTDLFGKAKGTSLLNEWYLKDNPNKEPFDILTNPPFKVVTPYILHAIDLIPEGGNVIMFLKTSFLEGKERKEQIFDKNPPRYVFQFSGRIVCAKNGDFASMKDVGSAVAFCFMIWNKHNDNKICEVKWI